MSTPTETPIDAPQGTPTPTPLTVAPTTPAEPPAQEPTDWKVEARKWEARSKENADAAKRLAAFEDAQKSESQKAAERLAALEAENAGYKQSAQRAEWAKQVSTDTGVPVDALRGSTLEEITAHAVTLKALITAPAQPVGPYVPGEGQSPKGQVAGQVTDAQLESMTPEQINQARREGRLNKMLGIH